MNAVLSLLYTLLINRCYAAIRLAGLDPYPAALHQLAYGRQSLPLDIVEEFRAMLADTITIALFNLHVLGRDDFESPPPETPEEDMPADDLAEKTILHDPLGSMTPNAALPDVSVLEGEQMEDACSRKPARAPAARRLQAGTHRIRKKNGNGILSPSCRTTDVLQ